MSNRPRDENGQWLPKDGIRSMQEGVFRGVDTKRLSHLRKQVREAKDRADLREELASRILTMNAKLYEKVLKQLEADKPSADYVGRFVSSTAEARRLLAELDRLEEVEKTPSLEDILARE